LQPNKNQSINFRQGNMGKRLKLGFRLKAL
jgi:hypothetical protein